MHLLLTAVAALASCVDDWGQRDGALAKNEMGFRITNDPTLTRTASVPTVLAFEEQIAEGYGTLLTEEVNSMDDPYMETAPGTRGTPVFTENFNQVYTDGFVADAAFLDGTANNTYLGTFTNKAKDHWSLNYKFNLPEEGSLQYFFHAPVSDVDYIEFGDDAFNTTDGSITFSVLDMPQQAVYQKDVLFTSKTVDLSEKEIQPILFYHAFTGVKFKLKEVTGTGLRITAIKKVELAGVVNKGSCTVTPVYDNENSGYVFGTSNKKNATEYLSPRSAFVSKWNLSINADGEDGQAKIHRGVFSQEFTDDESRGVNLTGYTDYTYAESFKNAVANQGKNLNAVDASKTFYLIPQTIDENVKLVITYELWDGISMNGGQPVTVTGTLSVDFGKKLVDAYRGKDNEELLTWNAGEIRTYTLSIGDKVNVEITDEVDDTAHSKSNVVITNSGTATAYMRVAIIGNWFTKSYQFPASTDQPLTAITPCLALPTIDSGYNTDHWVKGEDGYFYYKHPVQAGKTILPEHAVIGHNGAVVFAQEYASAPYAASELKVELAVQAVHVDHVADAWGTIKVANSEEFVVNELDAVAIDSSSETNNN